jgi:hypothetical protein
MKLIPVVVAALLGCADGTSSTAREPLLSCSEAGAAELAGCRGAGEACTWCAPVGEQCRSDFSPFCAHGLGWCDFGACTAICRERPGAIHRCDAGSHELTTKLGDGSALCLCVAD